jgi:hypothetical protein
MPEAIFGGVCEPADPNETLRHPTRALEQEHSITQCCQAEIPGFFLCGLCVSAVRFFSLRLRPSVFIRTTNRHNSVAAPVAGKFSLSSNSLSPGSSGFVCPNILSRCKIPRRPQSGTAVAGDIADCQVIYNPSAAVDNPQKRIGSYSVTEDIR